ncbi:MAG: hypothetical protein K0R54_800 [Clostridiaceae bacterium]|nr:hypothetical protein [Clostridiaceae bacterium]
MLLLTVASIFILITGCVNNLEKSNVEISNEIVPIIMKIEEDSMSETKAKLIIENIEEVVVEFGAKYSIEKKIDNNWYKLPYKDNQDEDSIAWIEILYSLNSENKKFESELDWSHLYGKLEPGNYRIIKSFTIGEDYENKYVLSAEFIIE